MLLSLGLFINLFISALFLPKYNTSIYLRQSIGLIILTLSNLLIDYQYCIDTLLQIDGSIRINSMILLEEIQILIIALFILISYIGFNQKGEYYLILLMNQVGMILLLESYEFLTFFISWELYNLSLYILIISNDQSSEKSLSVSLKYFLLSAFSTAFFLLAFIIFYYFIGHLHFDNIILLIIMNPNNFYLNLAILFMMITFLFKLSAVPLHYWSPDLYDNISTKITIWVAILPKMQLLFLVINLIKFFELQIDILILSGLSSLQIGSIGLTQQLRIKRFLTYSAITNLGFFLLAYQNPSILIQNLIIYSLTTLNIFISLLYLQLLMNREINLIIQIQGLYKYNPFLAQVQTLSFISLAGLPPLAGFFGKYLLQNHYQNNLSIILFQIIILTNIITISNYLKPLLLLNFYKNNMNQIMSKSLLVHSYLITQITFFIILIIFQPFEILNIFLHQIN